MPALALALALALVLALALALTPILALVRALALRHRGPATLPLAPTLGTLSMSTSFNEITGTTWNATAELFLNTGIAIVRIVATVHPIVCYAMRGV